jgi:beta-glucosidase
MSVEEKVGQTIQADIASITPDELRKYPLGSSWPAATRRRAATTAPRPRWVDLDQRLPRRGA